MTEPIANTLITIQAMVNPEMLDIMEKYGLVLLKERPGLCWEVPLDEQEEGE